jgi:hypothetical protein
LWLLVIINEMPTLCASAMETIKSVFELLFRLGRQRAKGGLKIVANITTRLSWLRNRNHLRVYAGDSIRPVRHLDGCDADFAAALDPNFVAFDAACERVGHLAQCESAPSGELKIGVHDCKSPKNDYLFETKRRQQSRISHLPSCEDNATAAAHVASRPLDNLAAKSGPRGEIERKRLITAQKAHSKSKKEKPRAKLAAGQPALTRNPAARRSGQ